MTTASEHDEHGQQGGIPGIAHTIAISGQSIVQNAIGSNYGTIYVILDEFHHRHGATWAPMPSRPNCAPPATAKCRKRRSPCSAPGRRWLGQCRRLQGHGPRRRRSGLRCLQEAADDLAATGNEQPGLVGLFSAFRSQTPQMYVDVDRERCKAMGVPLNEVFLTLQLYLGGYYTNDFNQFGRTWQVNLQGDPASRLTPEQVRQLKVRNLEGRNGAAGQRGRDQRPSAARRWSFATTA